MRRILTTSLAIIASLGIMANVALANDCANFSRPAPADPTHPVVVGNWIWLPGEGAWGFAAPGGKFSANFPGANGDFRHLSVTGNDSLLVNTGACPNPNRQTTNGIQNDLCPPAP